MPINFFDSACRTSSTATNFGLCDDPPPATNPAYIDGADDAKWIAEVRNDNAISVDFYAIDHCVVILRPNGQMESRCDGMLHYGTNLTFVELKNRSGSGWLREGREQLTKTIETFKDNYNVNNFNLEEGYVCNKQRPLAIRGNSTEFQKFKDDTAIILGNSGLLLKADRNIEIK
jgi:hypothetical protein